MFWVFLPSSPVQLHHVEVALHADDLADRAVAVEGSTDKVALQRKHRLVHRDLLFGRINGLFARGSGQDWWPSSIWNVAHRGWSKKRVERISNCTCISRVFTWLSFWLQRYLRCHIHTYQKFQYQYSERVYILLNIWKLVAIRKLELISFVRIIVVTKLVLLILEAIVKAKSSITYVPWFFTSRLV